MTGAAAAFVSAGGLDCCLGGPVVEDDPFVAAEEAFPRAGSAGVRPRGRLLPRWICPVWQIGDLHLRKPIVVTIEQDESGVLIDCASLRVWGAGDETYAALEDFQRTFLSVMESYKETPEDRMSRDAVEYLAQLRAFLPAES